jgi:hypothetical protein
MSKEKKKLLPKYALIKLAINNETAIRTQTQTHILRIKNKIKFMYKKKQHLNVHLYHTHIYNANIWKQTWGNSKQSITQKLRLEMEKVHLKQQKNK